MIWIIATTLILAFIILLILTGISRRKATTRYTRHNTLFTPAERSFLGVLNQVVASNAIVFGKVRVADVITPSAKSGRNEWWKAFNRISSKHFDFILCNKDDFRILCAIELDDKSHESMTRMKRDAFLLSACESAGLPLLQITAQSGYNIDELRHSLIKLLSADAA